MPITSAPGTHTIHYDYACEKEAAQAYADTYGQPVHHNTYHGGTPNDPIAPMTQEQIDANTDAVNTYETWYAANFWRWELSHGG